MKGRPFRDSRGRALPALARAAGLLGICLACLAGCAGDGDERKDAVRPHREPAVPPPPPGDEVLVPMIEQARLALQQGRLYTPPGDNAAELYSRHLDPERPEARAGIERVVRRSIVRALRIARDGDYKLAELYLTRAQKLRYDHPGIANARQRIQGWYQVRTLDFVLDPAAVALQSPDLRPRIREIVGRIRETGATFEVRTPSDDSGLWLYQEMLAAAGETVLRGNILPGREPIVRLYYRKN